MSRYDSSINKARKGYHESEVETLRNFYCNMLETLPEPSHSYEVVNYVNTLGLAILYTYPVQDSYDKLYYVGQNKVSLSNSYLGSIVSLRNTLNHANDHAKWILAAKTFVGHGNDDSRYDGVPLNLKKYCIALEKTNFGVFVNYIQALFSSPNEANTFAIVKMEIKVPRGRKHKFSPDIITQCRLLAPEVYKDLPEDQFCVVMKDTLLQLENESK